MRFLQGTSSGQRTSTSNDEYSRGWNKTRERERERERERRSIIKDPKSI